MVWIATGHRWAFLDVGHTAGLPDAKTGRVDPRLFATTGDGYLSRATDAGRLGNGLFG